MLTFKAEVLKSKQRKDGTYNIKVRITYNRIVKRLSTNIFVKQSDLTKSFKLKNTQYIQEADTLIRHYQELAYKLQLDARSYSIDDIIATIKGEQIKSKGIDFIKFSREWIAATAIKGASNYTTALNAFVAYLDKDSLNIDELTKRTLEGFIAYLNRKRETKIKTLIKQGKRVPSNRMVSLYLGSIRHLFNEAMRQYNDYDRDVILIPHSPFSNFKIPKQEATRKRAITAEQLRTIRDIPYKNIRKGIKGTCRFDLAKDCFILSFCLMGMNSVDLYKCPIPVGERISYNRTKTKDRRIDKARMDIDILPIIKPLLSKYKDPTGQRLFNFYHYYSTPDSFNKAINSGLKEIGKLIGVDDLEYYAARHSWATLAVNKVGIDKYTVHAALNHIDEAMKVTDIYIQRDFSIENKANRKVVEYVFSSNSGLI